MAIKCPNCKRTSSFYRDECEHCGYIEQGIHKNHHEEKCLVHNCSKCGHTRAKRVMVREKELTLCFNCYHNYYNGKNQSSDPKSLSLSEQYNARALIKINEARYYDDEEMLTMATRLYVLASDMKNGINVHLYSEAERLFTSLGTQ